MKVGIIGAMEEEVAALKGMMKDAKTSEKASMVFIDGTLNGTPVTVVKCGVGKVNAACCAQILADLYEVDCIINTGIAGSLDAGIDIGDIVLSTDAMQHDMDVTALGYEKGIIPDNDVSVFPADRRLRETAKKVAAAAVPDMKVFEGRVVSGDVFVAGKEIKTELVEKFHGTCAEMEGGAIAQSAYLNHIPFLIIRAISDKADDSAQMAYPEFKALAIDRTVKYVPALIEALNGISL